MFSYHWCPQGTLIPLSCLLGAKARYAVSIILASRRTLRAIWHYRGLGPCQTPGLPLLLDPLTAQQTWPAASPTPDSGSVLRALPECPSSSSENDLTCPSLKQGPWTRTAWTPVLPPGSSLPLLAASQQKAIFSLSSQLCFFLGNLLLLWLPFLQHLPLLAFPSHLKKEHITKPSL